MVNAYREILKQGATSYGTIMRHILTNSPPGNAIIVHCTAGKDRTGVFSALILSLCGVDDETVAEEYALTKQGLGRMDSLIANVVNQMNATEEEAIWVVGSRKESMLNTLKMLKDEFNGAEGYFITECGMKPEEVEKVKQLLIVDEAPIHK